VGQNQGAMQKPGAKEQKGSLNQESQIPDIED
jgi:hypothetical protein